MTEQITANFCLGLVCLVWPALWAVVGFNVGRHGARGWWRLIVMRLKAWGGNAR